MKLYTEEQLLNTVTAIQDYNDRYDEKVAQEMIEKHLKVLEPIEIVDHQERIMMDKNGISYKLKSIGNHIVDTNEMAEEIDYSPYCKECEACGEEGCCSALQCSQSPNGDYCATYLMDLRFGYAMNKWAETYLIDKLTDEQRALYNEVWDNHYDLIYEKPNK